MSSHGSTTRLSSFMDSLLFFNFSPIRLLFLHSDLRLSLYSGGEGNGNPLQYSCLESPMNKGAWWATVHRVTNSRTLLSLHTHLYSGCASLSVIKCHKYPFSSPV